MGLTLGRTAISHFFSQIALSASGFVATLVIARILGAEGLGIYALGISLVVWFNVPLAGFQKALTKRLSEGVQQGEFLTAGIVANVTSVLVPTLLVLVFREQINAYVGANVYELIILILLTNGVFNTFRDTLHGEKKVARAGWVRAAEQILRTLFQIALLVSGYAITGLFVGHALSLVVGALIALIFVDIRPAVPTTQHFRQLWNYAKHGWSGGFKGNTLNWMDTLVLGLFVSTSLVGVYEVAWTLASFLAVASNSVRSTLFPELSDISTNEDDERIHHYLNEGLVFTGVFIIPGFFGALALGTDLLRIYNTEFTKGVAVLVVLVAARLLDAYASQFVSVVNALDRPDIALRIDLVFVVVNMTLNVVLVFTFGWFGAALATLLSGGLSLVLAVYAITSLIGIPDVPYREIGREVMASLLMFAALLALKEAAPSSMWMTVLLVLTGAGIYLGILLGISSRIRKKSRALLA